MLRSVFYMSVGCCALVLACGASAPDGGSDPGNTNVGENAESLRVHEHHHPALPPGPVVGSPPSSGNASSPPASGNGSSGSSSGPPADPQPTEPGCAGPGTKVACPQACPIIDICRVCPDGSCGVPHVACNADGSCGEVTFECAATTGTCPEQCPVIDICQLCPDNTCGRPIVSCNPDGSCGNVTFTCN